MKPKCRHCGSNEANRPRRLCWSCFYLPGVKDAYPRLGKGGMRGLCIGNFERPLAPSPCADAPGSNGKRDTLEQRAAAGVALFHPGDAPADLD